MSTSTYKYKDLKKAVKNLKREYDRIDDESDKQLIEILILGCEGEMNKLKEERKKNNEVRRRERCERRRGEGKEERRKKSSPPPTTSRRNMNERKNERNVFASIAPYFIGVVAGAGLVFSTNYLIKKFKK